MELTYFLAQFMGIPLIIFAMAVLVRPKLMSSAPRDVEHESFSMLVLGVGVIIAGFAVVSTHNMGEWSWRLIFTLLGWSSLLKGTLDLAAPNYLRDIARTLWKNDTWVRGVLIVLLLFGIHLPYVSFGYEPTHGEALSTCGRLTIIERRRRSGGYAYSIQTSHDGARAPERGQAPPLAHPAALRNVFHRARSRVSHRV